MPDVENILPLHQPPAGGATPAGDAAATGQDMAILTLLGLLARTVEVGQRIEQHCRSLYASHATAATALNLAAEMRQRRRLSAEREAIGLARGQLNAVVAAEFPPIEWPNVNSLTTGGGNV